MFSFLPVNLNQFNDSEGEETFIDEGWESALEDFEEEWSAENQEEETEEELETETETSEETETETETSEGEEEEEETETESKTEQKQTPEENNHFKQMRLQLEEAQKKARVIDEVAKMNGITPEQVIQEFERKQLEEQAKQQNVPVEVMQKLQTLEQENKTVKQSLFADRFNREVEETKAKYNLTDEEVQATVEFMDKHKFPLDFPFETAYIAANHEKLVEEAKNKAIQEQLEEKKKRQNSSAVPHTDTGGSQNNNPHELSDEEYESIKKELGLD